jgi:UDP-N-acetylenolpyruvoylglucosamine reductase
VLLLIDDARRTVLERTGIALETEVKIWHSSELSRHS